MRSTWIGLAHFGTENTISGRHEMRIFFIAALHAVCFWSYGVCQMVAFENSETIDSARLITLISVAALVLGPLLFGVVYTKFLAFKLARAESKDVKQRLASDSNVNQLLSANSQGGQTRLSDMKMNIILRLWWKRQERLYKMSLDHDVDAQQTKDDDDDDSGEKNVPIPKGPKTKKSGKEKKKKDSNHGDVDSPASKSEKKHKKHHRSSDEPTEGKAEERKKKKKKRKEELISDAN